jgi:hypothetical protein
VDADLINRLLKILVIILIINFVFWFLAGNDYLWFISMIGGIIGYVFILFVLNRMGKLPPGWLFNR